MPDEVLTHTQRRVMHNPAKTTNHAMAQVGETAAFRIHGPWRVNRTELDQWIDAQPRGGDGGGRGE